MSRTVFRDIFVLPLPAKTHSAANRNAKGGKTHVFQEMARILRKLLGNVVPLLLLRGHSCMSPILHDFFQTARKNLDGCQNYHPFRGTLNIRP